MLNYLLKLVLKRLYKVEKCPLKFRPLIFKFHRL